MNGATGAGVIIAGLVVACAKPPGPAADRDPYWARIEPVSASAANGPYTAYLDRGPVTPAGADVPPALRGLPGRWQGWVGRNRAGSIAIEIDHLDADAASGRYAHAALENANGNLSPNRVFPLECRVADAAYLDCGLSRTRPAAIQVFLKPRADGGLMFLYTNNGGQGYTIGLLTRSDAAQ